MTHLLAGQVALVTGASGGIGRAIALRLAEEGAAVAVHCRTAVAAAREVASAIGDRAVVVQGDLTDEATCHRIVREAADRCGGRLTAEPVRRPADRAGQRGAVSDVRLPPSRSRKPPTGRGHSERYPPPIRMTLERLLPNSGR